MPPKTIKISGWIEETTRRLNKSGISEPIAESEIILSYLLGISRGELLAKKLSNQILHPTILEKADSIIQIRCTDRKPLAHILGKWDFMGLTIELNEHVLVPRPETEILVNEILKRLPDEPMLGIDVGTGSGAIAMALLNQRSKWKIIGTDFYEPPLRLAAKNAHKLGMSNRFIPLRCDLIEAIGYADFFVANLPYVPSNEIKNLEPEVRAEPFAALDGGENGLVVIRKFMQLAMRMDTKLIALEFGIGQASSLRSIADKTNWKIEIVKDYSGIERIAIVSRENFISEI